MFLTQLHTFQVQSHITMNISNIMQ